jgi:hypothetical protein
MGNIEGGPWRAQGPAQFALSNRSHNNRVMGTRGAA